MSNTAEVLEAMESALDYLRDALDEMKNIPDLKPHYDALSDVQYELTKDKDVLEAAHQTEYQHELYEMIRDLDRER